MNDDDESAFAKPDPISTQMAHEQRVGELLRTLVGIRQCDMDAVGEATAMVEAALLFIANAVEKDEFDRLRAAIEDEISNAAHVADQRARNLLAGKPVWNGDVSANDNSTMSGA